MQVDSDKKKVDSLLAIGEEITTENELNNLFSHATTEFRPLCYDGFEPSGRMHIAQGLLKTLFVKKMIAANCDVLFWIADWFAQLNNKMGGDMDKIHIVGEYMIEIWKACGMPLDGVQFVWASEEINKRPDEYWRIVMDICGSCTISRLKKCTSILGRNNAKKEIEQLVEEAKSLIENTNEQNLPPVEHSNEKNPTPIALDIYQKTMKKYSAGMQYAVTNPVGDIGVIFGFEIECWIDGSDGSLTFYPADSIKNLDDLEKELERQKSEASLKLQLKELQEKYDTYVKASEQAITLYQNVISLLQKENSMPTSFLLYAAMQCADIFFLKAHICQLGMDQRKVNVLAREYHDHLFHQKYTQKLVKYRPKPIIISHHMLMGLKEGQEKMSKSDPESAIFMDDSEADVNRKIKKAFCKPQIVENNPILDYYKHIVFPYMEQEFIETKCEDKKTLTIDKGKWGGLKSYSNYNDFEKDYVNGQLHPADIKPKLQKEINRMLQPVRDHFKNNRSAKTLMEKVKKFKITK